jgi:hypothetical protein
MPPLAVSLPRIAPRNYVEETRDMSFSFKRREAGNDRKADALREDKASK